MFPNHVTVPAPNHDLPQRMKALYEEAALVFGASPRSAAALLRLAIQELCLELGYTQRDLKKQLEKLAEDHNLDDRIIQALHIVRVVGNNAVHPGQINIDDTPKLTASLFLLINEIGDELYTKPKRLQELWESLPEGARKEIKLRDTADPT